MYRKALWLQLRSFASFEQLSFSDSKPCNVMAPLPCKSRSVQTFGVQT